jgi:predicted nucleic-acid-binding Zn-ribbon protein
MGLFICLKLINLIRLIRKIFLVKFDSFIKINTSDLTYSELMTANSETETNLDAIDLQISPSDDYLMFTNKNDLILWSLDIL